MNRTIWMFRIIGALVLVGMMLLMLNLYAKLRRMSDSPPPAGAAGRIP